MKVLVSIKQVPDTTQVEVDEKTGILKRDGVASKINPYDLYAVETGVRIARETSGTSVVLTMGPPQAEEVLREALCMGVDDAYLLTDRRFGGADVLATSYTLSQGIRAAGGIDLIICGKQTTDGDTAQVGPEIAEFLSIPHATNVSRIVSLGEGSIRVEIDYPEYTELAEIVLPALITVEKGINTPRLPSYRLLKSPCSKPVARLSLDDLSDTDPSHYGIDGSPTKVVRIFPPERNASQEIWDGEDLGKRLFDELVRIKMV